MNRHRQDAGPRHRLAPGRVAGRIPREYRQSGLGHRVVTEHPLAGVQAGVLTVTLAGGVFWFFRNIGH
jgi:hypothetical protein